MKATYQKPATDVIVLSTDALLVDTSNGIFTETKTPDNSTIDLDGDFNETGATSGNLSRRTVWDDEEEDF